MIATPTTISIWVIAALATAGVIVRPWRLPEAVWAVGGAAVLFFSGLLPWATAPKAVEKGTDVYLFLIGMMLLSETARREGLFEWLAVAAVNRAQRSRRHLFLLVYALGIVVTVFLSNDATAVVLTPAVYAVAKKARVEPLPYLFICAFIANAASFVLPISNPANLVLFADHTPRLGDWLARFALPSLLAIAATYGVLRWTQRSGLAGACDGDLDQPALTGGGWTALIGIGLTAAALLTVSALGGRLGFSTCVLGALTTLVVLVRKGESPSATLRGVSWSVLPLVAGLFVLVQAVDETGLARVLGKTLSLASRWDARAAAALGGAVIALVTNLTNNLPAGLIVSASIAQGQLPLKVIDALLVGVDLGPNLSITGSLATILWLLAIRREGADVGFWRFLRLGVVIMPPTLMLAVGARLFLS